MWYLTQGTLLTITRGSWLSLKKTLKIKSTSQIRPLGTCHRAAALSPTLTRSTTLAGRSQIEVWSLQAVFNRHLINLNSATWWRVTFTESFRTVNRATLSFNLSLSLPNLNLKYKKSEFTAQTSSSALKDSCLSWGRLRSKSWTTLNCIYKWMLRCVRLRHSLRLVQCSRGVHLNLLLVRLNSSTMSCKGRSARLI